VLFFPVPCCKPVCDSPSISFPVVFFRKVFDEFFFVPFLSAQVTFPFPLLSFSLPGCPFSVVRWELFSVAPARMVFSPGCLAFFDPPLFPYSGVIFGSLSSTVSPITISRLGLVTHPSLSLLGAFFPCVLEADGFLLCGAFCGFHFPFFLVCWFPFCFLLGRLLLGPKPRDLPNLVAHFSQRL